MADSFMINVPEGFELETFTRHLADFYRSNGFAVTSASLDNSIILDFDKGVGGINMLLGLDIGIKATFTVRENTLIVYFSDASWTGKIIGLCVGWFVCLVPLITAIVGAVKQAQFPTDLRNTVMMMLGGK